MAGTKAQVEGVGAWRASTILAISSDRLKSLDGIDTRSIPDRSTCFVEENGELYRFDQSSAAPPAPPAIVAPLVGPGRWFIQPTGGALEVLDEGISLGTFTKMNFEGAGVSAAVDGGDPSQVNVTIPGGGGGAGAVLSSVYSCTPILPVNAAVYLTAADSVDFADSDDASKQPLIGIVLTKPSPVTCIVTYYGEHPGFAGLTPGATYYLGTTPGTITTTAPTTPGNIVQRIGFARSATVLVVMVDRDWTEIT